jgi:phage terminase small subunit
MVVVATSPASKAWWSTVLVDYEMDPHDLKLLQLAAETWDQYEDARTILAREGLTVVGRHGLKAHPCVSIVRDARAQFAMLVKQLNLSETTEPKRPGRPPSGYDMVTVSNGKTTQR